MSSGSKKRSASARGTGSSHWSNSKRIKFQTLDFVGTRSKLVARPADATPRTDTARPIFHFNPRLTTPAIEDPWTAPSDSLEGEEQGQDDFPYATMSDFQDDLEDVVLNTPSKSGKGQNEMLENWLSTYGTSYMRHIYRQYLPPGPGELCTCGSYLPALFRCRECLSVSYKCKNCILAEHRLMPTHRIREWVGTRLQGISLCDLGAQLALGQHQLPCPEGKIRKILLGDETGFHYVNVVFCCCANSAETSPSEYQQLLDARIFPCSDERPNSAFTFAVLRSFHFAATDGKISGGRFYSLLARKTNSTLPDLVEDRYREFMRVARQWMFLQTKKRAGLLDVRKAEDLAIRCPACPRAGVNYAHEDVSDSNRYLYTTHLSYDGSFQLIRRQRAEDGHDVCLTDGALYFVATEPYEKHLSDTKDDAFANTKLSECNNHKAAIGAWSLYEGLAVTGVGACSCARHAFYMPSGVVNYYKGERFAYTDYALGSVIHRLSLEGCDNLGIYYDIYCHWSRSWWKRAKLLPQPVVEPTHYIGGVPKYHLAGHTDSCYVQYSLNNMPGVGRLDAEGCERLWADANQASGSTSGKGHGSRTDSLNYLFHDWNWRKVTNSGSLLKRKMGEALEMSVEKKSQWQVFDQCIDSTLREKWLKLDTRPYRENGKWRSVYLAPTPEVMSVTQRLRKLRELEETQQHDVPSVEDGDVESTEQAMNPFTAGDWMAEGFEIELVQEKLRRDVKSRGTSPTSAQALDIGRRRQALQQRLTRHTQAASQFYTSEQVARYILSAESTHSAASAIPGKPETRSLALPSRLKKFCRGAKTQGDNSLIDTERELRRAACLHALSGVRTTSQQKALLIMRKERNVRGEVHTTRVQGMITRLTDRVQLAVWEYRNSRSALIALGATENDTTRLRPLEDIDLSGLTSMLQGDRGTGEGQRQMPWFWHVRSMTPNHWDDSQEEGDEALQVEWFRGRARYERWEEEVAILEREMASVLFTFQAEGKKWIFRADSLEASFDAGYHAFCTQQTALWDNLLGDAVSKFKPFLQTATARNATCRRAAEQFL